MRPPKVDGTVLSKRLCFLVCQIAPKLQLDFRPQAGILGRKRRLAQGAE